MATKEALTLRKARAKERIIEAVDSIKDAGLEAGDVPTRQRDKDLEITLLLEYTADVLSVAADELGRYKAIERDSTKPKKTTKKGKK